MKKATHVEVNGNVPRLSDWTDFLPVIGGILCLGWIILSGL